MRFTREIWRNSQVVLNWNQGVRAYFEILSQKTNANKILAVELVLLVVVQ